MKNFIPSAKWSIFPITQRRETQAYFSSSSPFSKNHSAWLLFCLISEPRLTPLFQEEDYHQRLLIGLMVSELREHLLRHLQGIEKKKIEQMVLDYISKLLDLICQILETSWRTHHLHPWVLHLRASAAEFTVFHIMTRILEATMSLFLPLPPGKSWLFCPLL